MKVSAHAEKFRRLDSVLQRFDPVTDSEMWIWTAMNGCTHLLNAALHLIGASAETDSFHTQTSGLYAVPDRARGTLSDSMHAPGDVMHVGQPRINKALPPNLAAACDALRTLEDLRASHVRGSDAVDAAMAETWKHTYRRCVDELAKTVDMAVGRNAT